MKLHIFRQHIQGWMLKTRAIIVDELDPQIKGFQVLRKDIIASDFTEDVTILEDPPPKKKISLYGRWEKNEIEIFREYFNLEILEINFWNPRAVYDHTTSEYLVLSWEPGQIKTWCEVHK